MASTSSKFEYTRASSFTRARKAAALLCVALGASLLPGSPAKAASAPKPESPAKLPPLPAEPKAHEPSIPKGDFKNPPPIGGVPSPDERRASFDERTAKIAERKERATIFDLGNGNYAAKLTNRPSNWKRGDGTWEGLDTTLVPGNDGRFVTKSSPLNISIASKTSDIAPLVTADRDSWSVSMRPRFAAPDKPIETEGSVAKVRDIAPGMELRYVAAAGELKEDIVLNQRPNGPKGDLRYEFDLTSNAVTARGVERGIEFADASGAVVARMPWGVAFDSSDDGQGNAKVSPVRVELSADAKTVAVIADGAWLRDPSITYPVRIDPRLIAGRESGHWDADTASNCGNCNFNGEAQKQAPGIYVDRIGYWAGVQYVPYLSYDMNSIIGPGRQVTHADWVGHFYSADRYPNLFAMYPVVEGWQDFTLTWNNRPNHRPDTIFGETTASNQWVVKDLTTWVQNWITGAWSAQGITIAIRRATRAGAISGSRPWRLGPQTPTAQSSFTTTTPPRSPRPPRRTMRGR